MSKHSKSKTRVRYFNRELGWLEFNYRVLEEAMDENHPLLERLKFLAIFGSNLDEFFMLRIPDPKDLAKNSEAPNLNGDEQLALIRQRISQLNETVNTYFQKDLKPQLARKSIHLCNYTDLSESHKTYLKEYFTRHIYPLLTPLAITSGHPFPHISNLSLNLVVVLKDPEGVEKFARVKIPFTLSRLVPLPFLYQPEHQLEKEAQNVTEEDNERNHPRKQNPEYSFVWLEQVVAAHLAQLFEGMEIVESYLFRVIRDADITIPQNEVKDIVQTIEESLERRRFGPVIQLEIDHEMPQPIQTLLLTNLEISPAEISPSSGILGWRDLLQLYEQLDLPELKDRTFQPHLPAILSNIYNQNLFTLIRQHDILLHHPYDDFSPVVHFLTSAANDPAVLAIKQTIYRVGPQSPIVEALTQAALNGKQVTVLVELKARFDEESNLEWARTLERVGANVVFGSIELKTHCKVALVMRREENTIRRYLHLGTGNYNVKTARLYTDLGLLTCREELADDASALFNSLTGYSIRPNYQQMLVSPLALRPTIIAKIEREIEQAQAGKKAYLFFKMNAFTDEECIEALYRASNAGVKIDLVVRGSCCLVPQVRGMSENIRVISLVGRFLEHSRIYYFKNGGDDEELYLGSADLMERNLDHRVEVLFPVRDKKIKRFILHEIIPAYLKDNQKARLLCSDGTYNRISPDKDEEAFSAQDYFMHYQQTVTAEPSSQEENS